MKSQKDRVRQIASIVCTLTKVRLYAQALLVWDKHQVEEEPIESFSGCCIKSNGKSSSVRNPNVAINGVTSSHREICLYDSKKESSWHPKWHGDKRKGSSPERVWLPGSNCSWDPSAFLNPPIRLVAFAVLLYPPDSKLFFLHCLKLDTLSYQKKNPNYNTFQKKVLFFRWVRIYS